MLVLIGIYLIPLALNVAVSAHFVADEGPYCGLHGPGGVIRMVAISGCGLLRFVLPPSFINSPYLVHVVFALLWGGWFTLLWRTRLGTLSYLVHLAIAMLACIWCLLGAGIVRVGG